MSRAWCSGRESGSSPPARVPECRDPDDRKFLQLAYAAGADALVTGDTDLLALAGKSRVRILTPDALKALLEAQA